MKSNYFFEIVEMYKNNSFSSEYLIEGEKGLIQRFKSYEDWGNLSLSERMLSRSNTLIHLQKCGESEIVISYLENLIELGNLIIDFVKRTKGLLKNKEKRMSKSEVYLFRLHALLYCELYSINKEKEIAKFKHILFGEVVNPIFRELEETSFYSDYNLIKIELVNRRISEMFNNEVLKEKIKWY